MNVLENYPLRFSVSVNILLIPDNFFFHDKNLFSHAILLCHFFLNLCVHMCHMCENTYKQQKRMSEPLRLKLHVLSHQM